MKCYVCGNEIIKDYCCHEDDVHCCSLICLSIYKNRGSVKRELYLPNEPGARKNGKISVGQYVAQRMILKRPLKEGEHVFHKDDIKGNDMPDNLIVFASLSDMNRYMKNEDNEAVRLKQVGDELVYETKVLEKIVYKEERKCPICGHPFYIMDPKNNQQFCSIRCLNVYKNLIK